MAEEEIDFPKSTDPKSEDLATSTKRLADWTFSLQGVGADLKNLMNEFKAYWRTLVPMAAVEGPMAALIPEAKEVPLTGGIIVRQGSNVTKTVVEISERTLSVIAFGLAVAAFVIALWAYKQADNTRDTAVHEMKQVQIQLMYTNALMIREGLVKPGDMVYGPEGNLEYDGKSFKPKEK